MDRFFVRPEILTGKEVVLEGQQAHQICNVLRKKVGEHIIVLDNFGAEYEIELNTIEKEKVTGQGCSVESEFSQYTAIGVVLQKHRHVEFLGNVVHEI